MWCEAVLVEGHGPLCRGSGVRRGSAPESLAAVVRRFRVASGCRREEAGGAIQGSVPRSLPHAGASWGGFVWRKGGKIADDPCRISVVETLDPLV